MTNTIGNFQEAEEKKADVKETIEAVREYESNPKKILGLIGTVTRDDLAE